jgi:uncharacterized protein with HEPN domain
VSGPSKAQVESCLIDIIDAVKRINLYLTNVNKQDIDKEAFMSSREKQDAIIRNLGVIGVAASKILETYPNFAYTHSHIPWQQISKLSFREPDTHSEEDLELTWRVISKSLPELVEQIKQVQKTL